MARPETTDELDGATQGEKLERELPSVADDDDEEQVRDTSGRVLDAGASSAARTKNPKRKPKKKRKRRNRGPPSLAFKVQEFCDSHRISRAHYYNLKRQGLGPDETDVGGATIITVEAAARWRRRLEKAARA